MLGFNKPHLTGKELDYIRDAVEREKLSGNGHYTQQCQRFFESRFGFRKALLTQSCTDALEMTALLLNIGPGDEIILPSFTFVSTANAFALRGATLVFADVSADCPNLDVEHVRTLITPRTKAVVVVHYAGIACDMEPMMELSRQHGFHVIEDAAQAIDSYYKGRPLGAIGHLACFSFHETKNIISGEGGMLVINDPQFISRAEILWEKGTNRSAFSRGEVDKYSWIDIGSSFLPSEMTAAFLWAQLENIEVIQERRRQVWRHYQQGLDFQVREGHLQTPQIPKYATNNAHMFYTVFRSVQERDAMMIHLRHDGIQAIFHYIPLHTSPYFKPFYQGRILHHTQRYADCLLRLPFYTDLAKPDIDRVINSIYRFYNS
ncbi:MAG TPA: dTDP-4-amino-4,6-dideoxygalactose transaminase [Cyclobacteriaceae bacterium]|nr:dTDP-4-amino-4,6-dideoxygalactose transaminase [Cyclobacteriaceae bacterium]